MVTQLMVTQLSCGDSKDNPKLVPLKKSLKLLAGQTQNRVKTRKRDELHLTLNFNK